MKRFAVLVALLAVGCLSVCAQTATPRTTKRQVAQQERIKEGVKSGE